MKASGGRGPTYLGEGSPRHFPANAIGDAGKLVRVLDDDDAVVEHGDASLL